MFNRLIAENHAKIWILAIHFDGLCLHASLIVKNKLTECHVQALLSCGLRRRVRRRSKLDYLKASRALRFLGLGIS